MSFRPIFRLTSICKSVIKMLILVVILFAICWFPLQAYNFLTAVDPLINFYPYINIVWFCCNFLAMSNSCQNPFILGFCNEKFRQELRDKITVCMYALCIRHRDTAQNTSDYSGVTQRHDEQLTQQQHGVIIAHPTNSQQQQYTAAKRSAGKRYADHMEIPDDSPKFTRQVNNYAAVTSSRGRESLTSYNGAGRYD